ncbi:MAG TPA: CHRD domain-containing protein [Ottowia sp.]|nr:CHRD domain-containing protein [Ottowia sp.]
MTRSAATHPGRVLAATLLLATLVGCASVALPPHYDPPPILTPQTAPAPVPPPPPVAQSQPVSPMQPVPQPLPPVGATPAPPPMPLPAATPPPPPTEQADPNASLVTFSTRMDGDSAVPPTRSAGTGELDALYDTRSHLLRWKAKWSGLSAPITAVQFHAPGEIGQTAPPTMVWPGPFGPTYEGRATLTNQQATDLLSGRWYVNVYTANYPAGEIRGQLREVR